MIAHLAFWAMQRRGAALAICLLVCLAGAWSCWQHPLEAYPDISAQQVLVISTFPGRAPEEIERQITIPMEMAMDDVPNIMSLRSRTIFGLSIVEMTFTPGTDNYFARQRVQDAVNSVDLPAGAEARLGPLATAYGEIYRYEMVSTQGHSQMELRTLQDWVVARRLQQVAGVAEVVTFGGHEKQFTVTLDPAQLARYSLTLNEVIDAVRSNNANAGGSVVQRGEMSLGVRGRGLLGNITDLEKTVVNSVGGTPVYVRDVAQVDIEARAPFGMFGRDENSDSIEGIVLMTRGENPAQTLQRVKAEVDRLNVNVLPEGVRIAPFYDRDLLMDGSMRTVATSVLTGVALILLVLIAFLGSPSVALLVAATIPVALLFAILMLNLAGIAPSLLLIGAIDVGILVDGAVIMLDRAAKRLPRSADPLDRDSRHRIMLNLAAEVQRPFRLSLLMVLCAYVPLLTLTGVEGMLFRPMALTAILAILGGGMFSLLVIPGVAPWVLRRGIRDWDNPLLGRMQVFYSRLLRGLLRLRWLVVVGCLLAFTVAGVWVIPRLGLDFLPYVDEGTIWVRASFPAGTSLEQTAEFGDRLRQIVRTFPEVSVVASQAGRNNTGTDAWVDSRVEMMIGLKPRREWRFSSKRMLLDELQMQLQEHFPTTPFSFTQPIIDSVTEDAYGTSADLSVIISGDDFKTLRQLGKKVAAELRNVQGAVDVSIDQESPQPQLIIEADRALCARYNVQIEEVNRLINTAIGSEPVETMYEGERRFKIVVRFNPRLFGSIDALGQLPVFSESGTPIPLAQLATFTVLEGQTTIAREDARRCVTVRCDIVGRDQRGFVTEAQNRIMREVKLPEDCRFKWLGMFENLARMNLQFFIILPLTVAVIFGLLLLSFGRFTEAFLVLLPLPCGLVGGALALYARGMTLNVSSCVGFVTLFGVSMLEGTLMIRAIIARRRVGPTLDDAILDGARSCFRPILMTSSLGILGLLPASLAVGLGADIQRPLATVVVWGLLTATLMALLIVPVLARMFLSHPLETG